MEHRAKGVLEAKESTDQGYIKVAVVAVVVPPSECQQEIIMADLVVLALRQRFLDQVYNALAVVAAVSIL
tara:strand:- start:327 stop:536 length:210 start_codon:yes stop_codon:yes gene_type:complete